MARVPPPRPGTRPQPTPRELLVRTWPGRIFLAAAAIKLVVIVWRLEAPLPGTVRATSGFATAGLAVALAMFSWRLFVQVKLRLLWRVRRKLILSYIFIGVIPSVLILIFFLFAGSLVFMNVSAYLFKDGYDGIVDAALISAQAGATGIARNPASVVETIQRVHALRAPVYPGASVAYIAPDGSLQSIGPWKTLPAPSTVPSWVAGALGKDGAMARSYGVPQKGSPEEDLVARAVARVGGPTGGLVVVDIPLDDHVTHQLYVNTGVRLENVYDAQALSGTSTPISTKAGNQDKSPVFEHSLAQLDVYDWATGDNRRATVALTYHLRELYGHLASAQSLVVGGMRLSDWLLFVLITIGVLFLIIEAVALVMGLALARSITSSVHELFMGTERVRQGDFSHRINIASNDQLGELAGSFNQMTGSIENLLRTAAEKKRLEEELRIARQIQMSLLPRGPIEFAGIGVTALCVPAREVGGDYYDFFRLGRDRLGVLIADVSGKGTSAALYMAELKGLVLSLSQIYQSPRQLLLEVNRIISENLDTRSFITMTYAVLDLSAGTMTFARAGHTPLLYFRGDGGRDTEVLTPNGLVVGLRIPGAMEKFADLLEEQHVELRKGDVILLYTDGITEAMNGESDLFGEARLGRIVSE
ncbi:MAG TPA: SpoIIE family protein phosphatase, partial [Vicinamibacterales bacterium]|nr:SpoIIE family protein phosphatase [Vicinamibacterales bacterium]